MSTFTWNFGPTSGFTLEEDNQLRQELQQCTSLESLFPGEFRTPPPHKEFHGASGQQWVQPRTVAEVLEIMTKQPSSFVAGNTDLAFYVDKERPGSLANKKTFINLASVKELQVHTHYSWLMDKAATGVSQ